MSTSTNVKNFAVFGTIMSVLTVGALTGNIICFRMTRRLLKNKPSLALVLNLNMSDIIVASITWIGFMTQNIAVFVGVEIHVVVHKVFWSILVTLGNVTLLTLTGLAGDCFIALRWPLHYKEIATYRCINGYIAAIWVCSALAGNCDFFTALFRYTSENLPFSDIIHDSIVFTGSDRTVGEILTASVTMLISNLLSFLCLIVMAYMYAYILYKIRQIHSDRRLAKRGGFKSEIHAVRTTFMIFLSFLLLWLPTLVINIISVAKPDFLSKLGFLEVSIIGHLADSLLMVHSMVDAVIYGVRVKKTIRRQSRSRKNQADYSRANTIRKVSSDSGRTSPYDQNEATDDTAESDIQLRRLSTASSLRLSVRGALSTISERVDVKDQPSSEDSGINSPHKLSPQNDRSAANQNSNPAENNNLSVKPQEIQTEVEISDGGEPKRDKQLLVPITVIPMRSSLKKEKSLPKTPSQDDGISKVRFTVSDNPPQPTDTKAGIRRQHPVYYRQPSSDSYEMAATAVSHDHLVPKLPRENNSHELVTEVESVSWDNKGYYSDSEDCKPSPSTHRKKRKENGRNTCSCQNSSQVGDVYTPAHSHQLVLQCTKL